MIKLTSCISALGLTAAVLGGCAQLPAAGPDYEAPRLALSSNWSTAHSENQTPAKSDNMRITYWWRQLKDPHFISAGISGAIDSALDYPLKKGVPV